MTTPARTLALQALAALSLELPESVYDDVSKKIKAALDEVPRPHRDVRVVLDGILALIPTFPHVPVREQQDPATEAWRANNVRSTFQKLADECIYAPVEVQHHYWMRVGTNMKEHFPDILAMGVAGPDGVRIDGLLWKRSAKKIPDGSIDLWERAAMRVWMPEYFVEGGRWALTTESGALQ